MKKSNKVKDEKKSTIQVDPWLNKYSNVVLCPDKVEKARQTLEKFGLPNLQTTKQ
jgi:hypothetical protein